MTCFLQILEVGKRFGDTTALQNFSLDIDEGEFIFLLGPSGCGKTTLLRIIAGLEKPDTGRILQKGVDISRLPVAHRNFGIVFQSYALFPNLTVAQNVAYGLESQKLPRSSVTGRVRELLALVRLEGLEGRYPAQVSGGQQQRVALARALAISPDLLLLDEPLSALDARVRANLRMEIAALQRRLGITTIMVSHDQEEALTMADRIVVIDQGRVMQIGTPIEVYQTPATPFVANFVGLMNFLPGEISREETWKVVCGDNALLVPEGENPAAPGAPVTVAIRPEDVRVLDGEKHPPNVLVAQVEEVEFLGPYFRLHLELPSGTGQNGWLKLTTYIPPGQAHSTSLRKGARLAVYLPEHALRIFPRSGGRDDHPLLPDPGSRI